MKYQRSSLSGCISLKWRNMAVEIDLIILCAVPCEIHYYKINFQEVARRVEVSEKNRAEEELEGTVYAASFSPRKLVEFLASSALRPQSKTDSLQFATVKAQLAAFNRWKGRGQLPVLEECGLLLEDDDQSTMMGLGEDSIKGKEKLFKEAISDSADGFSFKKRNSTAGCGSSRKRKDMPGDGDGAEIKQKRRSALNLDLDAGNPSTEVPIEDRPTALILNFTSLDSIPSIPNLNEIFRRYGPLYESDTKILTKGKRVKMIFKRRADAETSFSSTGIYSIFGPTLVSYKLHYEAIRESRATSKRNRKGASGSI